MQDRSNQLHLFPMRPVFILLLSLVAAAKIRGVSPENQHLYVPEQNKWHCLLDPSIVLNFDQINDDFCDCPDGSDEPGTGACAFSAEAPKYFFCENEGYFSLKIENYKVDDGVCDYDICCDGSDEPSRKCENKCGEVRKQYDDFVRNRKQNVQEALVAKNYLVEKASQAKQELAEKLAVMKNEIHTKDEDLKFLVAQLASAELSGEDVDEDSVVQEALRLAERVEEKLANIAKTAKELQQKLSLLEKMLSDLAQNFNPNFNDASVKLCVKLFEEYMSNKQEETEEAGVVSLYELTEKLKNIRAPTDEGVVPSFENMVHHYFSKVISTFKPQEDKNDEPRPERISKAAAEINEKIKSLEKVLHSKSSEASIYEEKIHQTFGKNDILRSVEGVWVTGKIGEYIYKLGFLDSLYQDNNLVGRFSSCDDNTLYFTQGSKCWNGPQRSATVYMVCASENRLVSVSEPEKCQYRFVLETPLVCEALTDEDIARGFKVDISKLVI